MMKRKNIASTQPLQPLSEEKTKRTIWRPALSTPFALKWPQVECGVAIQLLEALLNLLDGRASADIASDDLQTGPCSLPQYKSQLRFLKKRKVAQNKIPSSSDDAKLVITDLPEKTSLPVKTPSIDPTKKSGEKANKFLDDIPQRPPFLNHVLLGINAVTKAVEAEVHQKCDAIANSPRAKPLTAATAGSLKSTCELPDSTITTVSGGDDTHSAYQLSQKSCASGVGTQEKKQLSLEAPSNRTCKQLSLIFVCTEDLNPISLAEHLLSAVAALNQHRLSCDAQELERSVPQCPALLIPLLAGAEARIAAALGIKRAAVVGLRGDSTQVCELLELAEKHIKPILPSNLTTPQDKLPKNSLAADKKKPFKLIPTHVKFYKTTAPIDMRKHQSERSQRKKQRKLLSKQKCNPSSHGEIKLKKKNTKLTISPTHKTETMIPNQL